MEPLNNWSFLLKQESMLLIFLDTSFCCYDKNRVIQRFPLFSGYSGGKQNPVVA